MTVAYLLPNGVGSKSEYTPIGDAPNWKCVDDPVGFPDDAVTYNKSGGDYYGVLRDYFTKDLLPAGAIINSVIPRFRGCARNQSGIGTTLRCKVFLNIPVVGEFPSGEEGINAGWMEWIWADVPFAWIFPFHGIASWAAMGVALFNASEMGYYLRCLGTGMGFVGCTQLYLEVNYTLGTPGSLASGIIPAHKKLFLGGA